MKREFNFTSILLVQIASAIVVGIFNYLFNQFNTDNAIVEYIGAFIIWFIGFIFNYIIASGLINNRLGSFGEYINQINTLTPTIILTNIVMSLIATVVTVGLSAFGGFGAFIAIISTASRPVSFGSIFLMILIAAILFLVFFLLTAYTNFVLADRRERFDGVGEYIGRIFKVGRDLLGKTLITYLKYIVAPIVLYMVLVGALLGSMINSNNGAFSVTLLVILSIILFVYLLVSTIILQARLSDNYLDYTGDIYI